MIAESALMIILSTRRCDIPALDETCLESCSRVMVAGGGVEAGGCESGEVLGSQRFLKKLAIVAVPAGVYLFCPDFPRYIKFALIIHAVRDAILSLGHPRQRARRDFYALRVIGNAIIMFHSTHSRI